MPASDATGPRETCVDVVLVARLLSEEMSARLAPLGVSVGQLPTLLALYGEDGQTQSALARQTGVEQPTMALTLRRMERSGLVRRVPDPNDRRQARVHLTQFALDVRAEVQAQRAQLDELSLRGLSPSQRHELSEHLSVMSANLMDSRSGDRPDGVRSGGTV